MKAGILTFHASHNYGSVLQNFALQQVLTDLGCSCETLNLRTETQKRIYSIASRKKGLKELLRNVLTLPYRRKFHQKFAAFEDFIHHKLKLSQTEYSSLEAIQRSQLNYDAIISGSDQIWNVRCADFDWSYFLDFPFNGRKIAYAPSFGTNSSECDEPTTARIRRCLADYYAISTREQRSADFVKRCTDSPCEVLLDPTLLLTESQWQSALNLEPLKSGNYILYYSLFPPDNTYHQITAEISRKLKLPVVVTLFTKQDFLHLGFRRKYATGPIEFLNLLRGAKLVVTSSFHGTAFSVLFQKPFYSLYGNSDMRIGTLLAQVGLQNRSVTPDSVKDVSLETCDQVDFQRAHSLLRPYQQQSMEFLKKALEKTADTNHEGE